MNMAYDILIQAYKAYVKKKNEVEREQDAHYARMYRMIKENTHKSIQDLEVEKKQFEEGSEKKLKKLEAELEACHQAWVLAFEASRSKR